MKKIYCCFFLVLSMMCSIGAIVYPARTNGNNTFFGTNYHSLPIVANGGVVVNGTNGITSSGSAISGVGMTNGRISIKRMVLDGFVYHSQVASDAGSAAWRIYITGGTTYIKGEAATSVIFRNESDGQEAAIKTGALVVNNALRLVGASAEPAAVAGHAQLYAATNATVTELYVQGSDGTETQISPHADDAPIELYDRQNADMKEIVWRERSPFVMKNGTNVGQVSFINLRRMARLTELNSKALLYLAGKTSAGNSNALEKLKDMTNAERQVIITETYAEHNARTGRSLVPKTWEIWQEELQVAYDADRLRLAAEAATAIATNAVLTAEGRTNELWMVPVVPEARDVRQPKPGWLW